MDIKQQVKEYLLKENITLTDLVSILNEKRPKEEATTVASLNNKLTRGTIRYNEIIEIAQALGYNIIWDKPNKAITMSSKNSSNNIIGSASITGGVTGLALGGFLGGIIGTISGITLDKTKDKFLNTEIEIKNRIKIAKEIEKELELQQEKMEYENEIENNIKIILKGILTNDSSLEDIYKDEMQDYLKLELPISIKFNYVYRTIYNIVSSQYNDITFLSLIVELRNIYSHGGFMDLSLEILHDLEKVSNYYIKEYFINPKQKD